MIQTAGPWGTGPYKLVKGFSTPVSRSDLVVLEANRSYWDRKNPPRIKRIVFDNRLTQAQAIESVRQGDGRVDMVTEVSPLDTLSLAQSRAATIVKHRKTLMSLFGEFNMRKTGTPWKDVRLRRAANYAVNRDDLITYSAKGNGWVVPTLLPVGSVGYHPDLAPYPFDPERARQLLREAGYPNGLAIRLLAEEAWKVQATVVSKMLEQAGFTVSLDLVDGVTYGRRVHLAHLDQPAEKQGWDVAITSWQDPINFPAFEFYNTFALDGASDWVEEEPELRRLYEQFMRTVDPDKQRAVMQQMERHVYDHAYFLFLYNPIMLYATNRAVTYDPSATTVLKFKDASVTDQHRSVRKTGTTR